MSTTKPAARPTRNRSRVRSNPRRYATNPSRPLSRADRAWMERYADLTALRVLAPGGSNEQHGARLRLLTHLTAELGDYIPNWGV